MAQRVRVLVVDDSAFMRSAISRLLTGDARFEVIGLAKDGDEAVQLAGESQVCVPFDTDYLWFSDTPDVCLIRDGADRVAETNADEDVLVEVSGPGLCRLRAHSETPRTPDAILERTFF